jgi:predicted nucleotidyltransferase
MSLQGDWSMSTASAEPRLTQRERDGIRRAIARACAEIGVTWRRVILFGSRAIPASRGGDIDLLLEVDPGQCVDTFRLSQRTRLALEDELGEQRIDLVIDDGRCESVFPVIAREQGMLLWSNT